MERFHRHLKGALKARLTNTNWIEELPYGTARYSKYTQGGLVIHFGDFFSSQTEEDPSTMVSRLRNTTQRQQFLSPRWHGSWVTYIPSDLHTATHVYVRRDAHAHQ